MMSLYFNDFHSNSFNNYSQQFGRLSLDATALGIPDDQPICAQIIYSLHGKTPGIFSFIQKERNGMEIKDRVLYQKIGSQGYKYRTAYIALEPIDHGSQTTLVIEVATFPTNFGREVVASGTFSLRLIDIKTGECPTDPASVSKYCDFETGLCDYDPEASKWKRGKPFASPLSLVI